MESDIDPSGLSPRDVRAFLLQNQDFAEEYFVSNATPAMIENWFDFRSQGNSQNGHVHRTASFNCGSSSTPIPQQVLHEEDSQEQAMKSSYLENQGPRRNSEPVAASRTEKKAAFKLRDMRKKKALTQYRVHHNLPNELSYTFGYDSSKQINFNKPSLRKTQSAPIYKSVLSRLINSTVYIRSFPTQDTRFKLDLRSSSEDAFLTEIIHDIMRDLNLESLCHKVVINVGIITDAHVASLYLVEQIDQHKVLRICYEDLLVHSSCNYKDGIAKSDNKIKAIGDDVIGRVARTGQTIQTNVPISINTVQLETVPQKREILCKPIKNFNGDVIAVISLGGKIGTEGFGEQDDMVLERYLTFCGISIMNARLFGVSKEEFDRNKALLELAHGIFEEQTSLSNIVNQTLRRAIELFSCKQCVLMLIADEKHANLVSAETSRFSHVFKMSASNERNSEMEFSSVMRNSMDIDGENACSSDHLVDYVSLTGKIFNSSTRKKNNMVNNYVDDEPCLCIPFRDNQFQIIGIIKLIRKAGDSPFNEKDEQILEAFTIFSGLGISNCILYDEVCRAKVHQKVALEVLSYHTSASQLEVDRLKLSSVPTAKVIHLYDLKFDDFQLIDGQMLTAAVRMFVEFDFLKKYQIKYETFCRWLLTVKKNYRRVIYHNWRHAFNVAQSMFAVLTTGNLSQKLSSLECLALLVGCLCHDLDHRGTNNEFQTKSESPLGKLYGTSPLEHHHFNHAVAILNSEGNNIFQSLSSSEYSEIMKYLKHAILATDLTQYFKIRDTLFPLIENQQLDLKKKEHKNMLRGILMTACDLSGITKPWGIQKKVVHLVTSEFFHQGDIEREKLQVEPMTMMDRKHILQLPKLQVQFFNSTGIPVYKALSLLSTPLQPLAEGALSNRNQWERLSKKIDEGTVDPELDPVFKPVNTDEDFTYL